MTVRILHFIDTLGAGGAERQLVYLLENLNRQRFEPHVVTTYDTFRYYESTLRQLGVPVYSLHHGALQPTNRVRALMRYVHLLYWLRPELVHSWLHYPNLIARGARPLCPPHCLITATRTRYSPRQRLAERLTSSLSDFRIVNHESTRADQSTIYIPNAVTQAFFTPSLPKPTQENRTILMVARIDQGKGHLTLLKALHKLKQIFPLNFELLLIGQISNPSTQKQIEQAIHTLGLSSIVRQLPPQNNLVSQYYNATATLLPSISEGFPSVMLESLAAGTPVITSEAANHIHLIQHGKNGWVFPTEDSSTLALHLKTALQLSAEDHAQIAINCRETAAPFTINRMVRQYEALYTRALSSS